MKRTKQILWVALLALFLMPTACTFEPELDLERYESCNDDGSCDETACTCLEKWWVCAPVDPKARPETCHPAAPDCREDADCDDDEDCTDDRCEEGNCVIVDNNNNDCSDENPCTDDSCEAGICTYVYNTNACTDDNPCTDDSCVGGACDSVNNDANLCDDENPNTDNVCRNGECVVVVGPDCTADEECPLGTWCEPISCIGGSCVVVQRDDDGDGFIAEDCEGGTDCDDSEPLVNPDGWEGPYGDLTCNNDVDDDCDGQTNLDDADCQPYEGAVSVDGWRWENPLPTGNTINDFWFGGEVLWAVGDAGTILRWDGLTWDSFSNLTHVDLNAVWGCSGHVWVFGDEGTILHRDGVSEIFNPEEGTPGDDDLLDAWGSSCSDMWVVGDRGTVLQLQGSSWNTIHLEADGVADLYGIWGHEGTIWVVGADRTLLMREHQGVFTDQGDQLAGLPTAGLALNSIWGHAGGELWIGASGGVLLHRGEGEAWSLVNPEGEVSFIAVHADPQGVFYALDGAGSLWRLDGVGDTVTLISNEGTGLMRHLWAQGPDRIFVGGTKGILAVHDGVRWRKLFVRLVADDLNAVHGPPGGAAWAVGNGGTIILRRADGTWTGSGDHGQGTTDLFGICITMPETGWIVGDGGIVLVRNGGPWQVVSSDLVDGLFDVFGHGPEDMVAVGTNGTLLGRQNGQFVTSSPADLTDSLLAVHMISGAGGGYAVGESGINFFGEHDSDTGEIVWEQMDYFGTANWRSVFQDSWESAWIVGEGTAGPSVLRLLNGNPAPEGMAPPNTDQALNAVWGTSPEQIWIAGGPVDAAGVLDEQAYVGRWTGSVWIQEYPGCKVGLTDFWDDGTTLFAVGKAGAILSKDIEQ